MKKILNLKSVILAFSMLFVAIAFNSCATGGSEFDYPLDDPATTGLCGTKWVLQSVMGGENVEYSSYVFNLDNTGYSEEKTENDTEITRNQFTWKSYNLGANSMHMLSITMEGSKYEMSTFYVVTGTSLRLNNGQGGIFTFVPEEFIDNKEDSEEEAK